MKTIVNKNTKLSKYITKNAADITLSENYASVIVDGIESFYIDVNSINSIVVKGVTPPADWEHDKYRFDASTWILSNKVEEMNFADAIKQMKKDFRLLKQTFSNLILEASTFNDPAPAGLTTQIDNTKLLCKTIKQEINALTASDYLSYNVISQATIDQIDAFNPYV